MIRFDGPLIGCDGVITLVYHVVLWLEGGFEYGNLFCQELLLVGYLQLVVIAFIFQLHGPIEI